MTKSVFHIARLTLEAETALSIASGLANGVFDSNLVMDANGLPAIPGSALAGVLRSLYHEEYDEAQADQLFGFQSSQRGLKDDSCPSSLNVSWGCIQNSKGEAVQSLCLGRQLEDVGRDSILKPALALTDSPVFRDRVSISHKGVSANTGKFDRAVLPAGYRFGVELSMWAEQSEPGEWKNVLALLKHPLFRLGGMTRAGLGKMKLVAAQQMIADLSTENGRISFVKLSADLNDFKGFSACDIPEFRNSNELVTATITLKPNSYWRIGQGSESAIPNTTDKPADKPADLLPKLEQKVNWPDGANANGGVKKLLIPATSVKGTLAHRVAFHANRLNSVWADEKLADDGSYDKSEDCEEVKALFGFASDSGNEKDLGQAGTVYIDDAYRDFSAEKLQVIMHNSIDRFSGGVRDHMLFSEEMVWDEGAEIHLTVMKREQSSHAREALESALKDLCEGRLALGAGSSKGHGFFTGNVKWSDDEKWLKEGI